MPIVDPMNGEVFINVPDTQISEIQPFVDSLKSVPKSGLHNPLKNPERYLLWTGCMLSGLGCCLHKWTHGFFCLSDA